MKARRACSAETSIYKALVPESSGTNRPKIVVKYYGDSSDNSSSNGRTPEKASTNSTNCEQLDRNAPTWTSRYEPGARLLFERTDYLSEDSKEEYTQMKITGSVSLWAYKKKPPCAG